MKKPKKFTLSPHDFQIRWSKRIKDHGVTDFDKHIIDIRPGLSTGLQRTTLLHEILHACLENCSLMDPHDPEAKVEVSEEDIVTYLAPLLLQALRTNKDIVNFLLED